MYDSDKGYPPTTPAYGYSQPGPGGAYPNNPPPYTGGPTTTVVMNPTTTTVILQTSTFTDTPASCTCPSCRQNVISRVVYNAGLLAWLIFGILCLLGCWLGCCLIPFCVDGCKDVDHFCPNCNHHLAKYKRL